MVTAPSWIREAVQWIAGWFPSIEHLECTDIAVCITRGSRVKVLAPGMHIYWSFWSVFYRRPANIQTKKLPVQTLITTDERSVTVGGMIRYEFDRSEEGVQRSMIGTDDAENSIVDEAEAVFCAFVTAKTLRELMGNRAELNRSLTGRLATKLATYGVAVLQAQLTNFAPCIVLSHISNTQGVTPNEEEGEE